MDGQARRTATVTVTAIGRARPSRCTGPSSSSCEPLRRDRPFPAGLAVGQVARLSENLLEVLFSPTKLRIMVRVLVLFDTFGGVIPLTQEDDPADPGGHRLDVRHHPADGERDLA